MSPNPQPSRRREANLTPRKGFSPVPRIPVLREEHLVLDDVQGETGMLLWHLLLDMEAWSQAPEERLFRPREDAALLMEIAPEPIRPAVQVITRIWWAPETATVDEVADACAAIWEWAEKLDFLEMALQFAERAARLQPTRSDRSSTAGRFCRLRGEPQRGTMWFRRAVRIAQAKRDSPEIAVAHLGAGNLASGAGWFSPAEEHYRKAVRAARRGGNRGLEGCAHHNMLLLMIRMERYDDAWVHARNALAAYKRDHARFPSLAHDIALLWMHWRYFSSAMAVFERVLAMLTTAHERMVTLANVARCAAASGDRLRYRRAVHEFVAHIEAGHSISHFPCYFVAQAGRTAQDWELAEYALHKALAVNPQGELRARTFKLMDDIAARLPGDQDLLPEPGSEVEQIREELLVRLYSRPLAS